MTDITELAQEIKELKLLIADARQRQLDKLIINVDVTEALVEALEKAQTERDEFQQGFIANQEEANEAIKYATELKEQLARACAGREEAVREVEEIQKTLDHIHRRRVIWRGKAVTAEDEVATLRQRIAELEEAEQQLCAAKVTLDARAELAERQLADLESRTVTVKLPERYACELGYNAPDPSGDMLDRDDVLAMLADAGIKWEAE